MNKKLLIGSTAIAVIGGIGLILPLSVSAAEGTNTFVQKLAKKLGIDESAVQTAVDSVQTDIKSEIDTKRQAEIAQAVTDGKLTQRQADILNAIPAAMEANRPAEGEEPPVREDLSSLTEEERQAKMEEMRTERDKEIIDALNANGLNVTQDELDSAQQAARGANLRIGIFVGSHRGPGGFGMFGVRP